jgi:hypothetical protein
MVLTSRDSIVHKVVTLMAGRLLFKIAIQYFCLNSKHDISSEIERKQQAAEMLVLTMAA